MPSCRFFLSLLLASLSFFSFAQKSEIECVDAKELIEHTEKYIGKVIETNGQIVHICGVTKKKMKLNVENVGAINIIPKDSNTVFDYNFNQKEVKVTGIVKEFRLSKEEIDDMEKNIDIPCSIDKKPCIDNVYIENKRKNGNLEQSSNKAINTMRETLKNTKKDYISVITIVAQNVELK